ncbi:MAG: hypothetical protein UX57_C0010G0031 [Candidatus Uhrbacteria bacterium GW2011_GWE2_46_68]|uniref:PEGA domain-containing protein n=2 Tax=Candidatus Uhriibacteriota TaxID=1752732 RepID=A0A0G1Q7G6_9BACT|nr:MAG: hypothetical protein UX45_C0012G0030 [Candidatus Uhrbacteria bacterium GW2011_GWF2_46_218]KKU40787.1 MAG: hypothetical protein UX57_C0010G0031 [Candidatus Uhrbacteria bacterium GW2011_GWE2_46_68]
MLPGYRVKQGASKRKIKRDESVEVRYNANILSMPPLFRRILFYLFLFCFLISAPLAVLYTAGYRYDVGSGMVIKTGVLSLESAPKGATVRIDDIEAKEKTPAIINTIIPGEHDVQIIKDGYLPWEKTLRVQSNQTTFASATLFLVDAPQLFSSLTPTFATTSPNREEVAFVTRNEETTDVWRLTANATSPFLIASFPSSKKITKILWSPEARYLLLQTTDLEKPFSIYTRDGDSLLNPSQLFETITALWWDVGQDGFLFLTTDTKQVRLNIANGLFDFLDLPCEAARTVSQGLVIVQQTIERASLIRTQNGESTILAYLPSGNYQFHSSPDHVFLLEDTRHQRILLLDARGGDQPILLNDEATLWQWNQQGHLLVSDGFDLHVYDSYAHTDTLLTRTSEHMSALIWYATGTDVVFCLPSTIQAVEIDERGSRHAPLLAVDTSCTNLWMDTDGKTLSFFGTIGGERGWFEKKMQE